MNMMFENNKDLANTLGKKDYDIIPVSTLDEVVTQFSLADSEEFFLVRVKSPLNVSMDNTETQEPEEITILAAAPIIAMPPPFRAVPQMTETAVAEANTKTVSEKINIEEVMFLNENAQMLLAAGEVSLARNIFRAILKSGEASDIAYAGLAECSDREGLLDQAIQFAWDSVAFAPNKQGYQILSQLLVQQGRDREAASALTRALKSLELNDAEKAEYNKMMGNCFSRLGENQDAEVAYKKALELSPQSDEIQTNLGSLYLEQSQMSEAKRCYQDAIAANALNDKAWVGLGLCYVTEGNKEQAHEAFSKSLELNLRNSTAIFHLVKCAYEIKKYSTAEKMLSTYVEIAPVSPSLLYSLAGLQFHVGKRGEAAQTAKRILQIKADHQGARDLISRIESEDTAD